MGFKLIYILGIIILILSPGVLAFNTDSEISKNVELIRQKEYDELMMRLEIVLENENIDIVEKIYKDATITLLQQFDYEKALEVIELFLDKYSETKESRFFHKQQGIVLKDMLKYKEAAEPLEKFIDIADYNFSKRLGKNFVSEIYYIYNQYEKAEEYLEWIISDTELPEDYVPAANLLIEVYFAQGKMEEAYELIQKGLKIYGKENKDIRKYYLQYRVKLAQYYFIKKEWSNFRKANKMPLFWNDYTTNIIYELNDVYKYRKDEKLLEIFKQFSLKRYKDTIYLLADYESKDETKELMVKTMEGVSYFWLDEKEKARDILQETISKNNIFLDYSAYYLGLMSFDEGDYMKAQAYLDIYDSVSKYSTLRGKVHTLYYRIKNRVDKIHFRY